MPFQIIRGDITKIECDAIVNSTNEELVGQGLGVDGAIHTAAGPELQKECSTLGGCEPGKAKSTRAYNLPCKYSIHTVAPVWQGGDSGEEITLASCYHESLELALKLNCESVAFPLLASGVYGYPKDRALNTALSEIGKFLMENEMLVYIVVFDQKSFKLSKHLLAGIKEFIDDDYILKRKKAIERKLSNLPPEIRRREEQGYADTYPESEPFPEPDEKEVEKIASESGESFSQMLLRKIDEKGMKDPECYKASNISKQHFSKIASNVNYNPTKATVFAFAIGLKLDLEETSEMLMKAGYAFSPNSKLDRIVRYFISIGYYNIIDINAVLYEYHQTLLGAS